MWLHEYLKNVYCSTLWWLGGGEPWVSRLRRDKLVNVLSLHQVSPEPDPFGMALHPRLLDEMLTGIRRRLPIVSLADTERDGFEGPAVVLSFDDGYHDFIEYAMPILHRHRVRAAQNVVAGCVESGKPIWNVQIYDFLKAAPDSLLNEIRIGDLGNFLAEPRPRLARRLSATLKQMPAA